MPEYIPSPYNFVPLSEKVFFPDEWSKQASIDIPYKDGISGTLTLRVTTKTPIYIRNGGAHSKDNKEFFSIYPGGSYAIPGSSLKGMLRGVIEIASFGKIVGGESAPRVSDRHFEMKIWSGGKSGRTIKTPARFGIHDAIRHNRGEHINASVRDFSETLFGHVEASDGIRGRVSIGTLLVNNQEIESMPTVKTILGAPKPSFHPNYVVQNPAQLAKTKQHTTYDDGGVKIRGWKRYIVRPDGYSPEPDSPKEMSDTATEFCPLPKGTTFSGLMHLHNVRPVELGALIWAITWGGDEQLRHSLGMGKPYGYGSVSIQIIGSKMLWCDPSKSEEINHDNMMLSFTKEMELRMPGWSNSVQIRVLKSMANPVAPWPSDGVRYPKLEEFSQHTKAGRYLMDPASIANRLYPTSTIAPTCVPSRSAEDRIIDRWKQEGRPTDNRLDEPQTYASSMGLDSFDQDIIWRKMLAILHEDVEWCSNQRKKWKKKGQGPWKKLCDLDDKLKMGLFIMIDSK